MSIDAEPFDVQEIIRRQEAREESIVQDLLDALDDFCDTAYPVWQWGDGDGGYVFDRVKENMHRMYPNTAPGESITRPSRRTIRPALRIAVYERDMYRCQHCGAHKDLTLDHIHPYSKGGRDTLENLQTLCRSCNARKGVR